MQSKSNILAQNIPWFYQSDINDIQTLFSAQTLPYTVEAFICSCLEQKIIIVQDESLASAYICETCGNKHFYDANLFSTNTPWYDPLSKIFNEEELEGLSFDIYYDSNTKSLLASWSISIPHSVSLIRDKVGLFSKKLYEFTLNEDGEIQEILHANFELEKLERFFIADKYYFDKYPTQSELINMHPRLSVLKNQVLAFIQNTDYFHTIKGSKLECKNLEEIAFFLKHPHLKSYELHYWKDLDLLPHNKTLNLDEAMGFIANGRTEKSLKKALYASYKRQRRKYEQYFYLYHKSVCKYIKDINIATRMIALDFQDHFEHFDEARDLDVLMEFLIKRYTEKQIEKLFENYEANEPFYILHTLTLLNQLDETMRDNFQKVACDHKTLHDELARYHQMAFRDQILSVNFSYATQDLKKCATMELYTVKLPMNGAELYAWSSTLNNCLSSYAGAIKNNKSTVYGFLKENIIEFAVEIQHNQIFQARSKYNEELSHKDRDIVNAWFKEYF
ncbi:PcfJ domain-containing protein [bacterium]|nr:PcfJ domain-containing protein [bacterium]MBU1994105.1 PcfJ domain-containing protein [bacterium]